MKYHRLHTSLSAQYCTSLLGFQNLPLIHHHFEVLFIHYAEKFDGRAGGPAQHAAEEMQTADPVVVPTQHAHAVTR